MKKVLPVLLITAFILSGLHVSSCQRGDEIAADSSSPQAGSVQVLLNHYEGEEESEVRSSSRARTRIVLLPEVPAPAPLLFVQIKRDESITLPDQHKTLCFSLRAPPASVLFKSA